MMSVIEFEEVIIKMDEANYILDRLYVEAMRGEEEVQRRAKDYADDVLRLMERIQDE